VGLFAFVGQVVDILAIFPQTHTLVVMTPFLTGTYSMRIANEERANLLFNAEVNHLARGLVSLIADTVLSAFPLLVFRVL